jgi:hypothetical protein
VRSRGRTCWSLSLRDYIAYFWLFILAGTNGKLMNMRGAIGILMIRHVSICLRDFNDF